MPHMENRLRLRPISAHVQCPCTRGISTCERILFDMLDLSTCRFSLRITTTHRKSSRTNLACLLALQHVVRRPVTSENMYRAFRVAGAEEGMSQIKHDAIVWIPTKQLMSPCATYHRRVSVGRGGG